MRKRKTILYVLTLAAIIGAAVMFSCTTQTSVEAPAPSSEPMPPPERSPDIQSISAQIITENGMLTSDVNVTIGLPGYLPATTRDWIGNVAFYLDVEPPTTAGESATTVEGTYQQALNLSTVRWSNLVPGMHTFSAQLVSANLEPLDPPVIAQTEIMVPPPASTDPVIRSLLVQTLCSPRYRTVPLPDTETPEPGGPCADINVSPIAANFTIVDKMGQSPVSGEGHFIYYFDVEPPKAPGQPAYTGGGTYVSTTDSYVTWTGVQPGEYEMWVQLVNNDDTPLEPALTARTFIIVPIDAARYYSY